MKSSLKPLKPKEVYVAITQPEFKAWREYPLPTRLVAESTIMNIYEPVNDSVYVMVIFNSPPKMAHHARNSIYIFSYAAHALNDGTYGLTPAFEP